ncbi:MAG: SUMF1/EgtB/PvdO family nonheme iron enzyme [Anaerolineales bacterium]
MVSIPAGEFLMGSESGRDNEKPQRLVYLDAFEIDRYEVVNEQYHRFIIATGRRPPRYWNDSDYPPGQADIPVVGVGWLDADAYCAWVGKRLPTEAEWEKACRGTDERVYPWGDTWYHDRANVGVPFVEPQSGMWDKAWIFLQADPDGSELPGLRPIGTYPEGASAYGVMDMAGNASEWVLDWYNWSGYWETSNRNPLGLEPPWNRCLRGSSWYVPYGDIAQGQFRSRCSARNSSHSADVDPRIGFRCARSISETIP